MRMLTVLLALALHSASALAGPLAPLSPGRGRGGPGLGMGRCALCAAFDEKALAEVAGTVEKVVRVDRGRHEGVHWMLKTAAETIEVHVGPSWFLERQEPLIAEGDAVTVRGSWVTVDGKKALVAVSVAKDADTLELRSEDGRPRWMGWRRRSWR